MRERPSFRVAVFRFRSTARHRVGGYLAVIVIIGLLGGLSLAAVAGARRTQSAFPRFIAASNPSDISIDTGPFNPGDAAALRHLGNVKAVRPYVSFSVVELGKNGFVAQNSPFNSSVEFVGSVNGLYFTQDRIAIIAGRRASISQPNEAMISQETATQFHIGVGDTVPVGFFTARQINDPNFDPFHSRPYRAVHLRVVGIGEFADEVVQDDVDRVPRLLLTPALTRQMVRCCSTYTWNGLQLRNGAAGVPALEAAYESHIPKGAPVYVRVTSVVEAQGERAVKPESIALGVFGVIIALAALVLASQAIGRQIGLSTTDHAVMRALGATPSMLMVADLVGLVTSVVLGVLVAGALAVAVSPIAPIGVTHRIEVNPGINFDWTVLLLGMAGFALTLGVVASVLAYRQAPHRVAHRGASGHSASRFVRTARALGLPLSAVTGIGLTVYSDRRRNAVPMRSAIVGTAIALFTLIGAVTFGASLNYLVAHPDLYGWNWTKGLIASSGYGDIPGHEAATLLNADRSISAWNGLNLGSLQIDGKLVPAVGATRTPARLNPPILSGRPLHNRKEILVGATTLADLHKRVGDLVKVTTATSTQTLRVVGTATMPALGVGHGLHMSMGSGAWVAANLVPAPGDNNPLGGPNILLVRYATGATTKFIDHDTAKLAGILSNYNPTHADTALLPDIAAIPVQHPAEIVNYRAMGAAPVILGVGLAVGASLALAATLFTSVRRRRRDLALLKSLGFTRGQLRSTVMWQSSMVVLVGALIGFPLGIAFGRFMWDAFADELHVVAYPDVPALWIAVIAAGTLILANVVAAIPGRVAGRVPAATVLRNE